MPGAGCCEGDPVAGGRGAGAGGPAGGAVGCGAEARTSGPGPGACRDAARAPSVSGAARAGSGRPVLPPCSPVRGESARNAVVPSEATGPSLPVVPGAPASAPSPRGCRRNTTVPSGAGEGPGPPGGSVGGIIAVPSVRFAAPSGRPACGTRGSAAWGAPTRPGGPGRRAKPDCRERSAPQAEAGSGRLPCRASAGSTREGSSTGSSSKKCGPVSSTAGGAGRAPGGGESGPPSLGAGRLVPGTQATPFQYRTYPGMDGSG